MRRAHAASFRDFLHRRACCRVDLLTEGNDNLLRFISLVLQTTHVLSKHGQGQGVFGVLGRVVEAAPCGVGLQGPCSWAQGVPPPPPSPARPSRLVPPEQVPTDQPVPQWLRPLHRACLPRPPHAAISSVISPSSSELEWYPSSSSSRSPPWDFSGRAEHQRGEIPPSALHPAPAPVHLPLSGVCSIQLSGAACLSAGKSVPHSAGSLLPGGAFGPI